MPEFSHSERELLKGSADFFGLNHYTTSYTYPADHKTCDGWQDDRMVNTTFTAPNGTSIGAAADVAWLADGTQRLWVVPSLRLVILRVGDAPDEADGWDEVMIPDSIIRGTSGWQPRSVGEGLDPKKFAPH